MSLDPRQLRDAFGAFLTGVTVVTTMDAEGRPIGFTANSFTSVSLDPPLLLVCLARTSRNFETMTQASGFAINILSEGQKDISNTFARPVEDRFAAVTWERGPQGSPVFEGVAAWFDCAMHQVVDAGDHVILIGRVAAFANSGLTGLGYARGSYFIPSLGDKAMLGTGDMPQVVSAVAVRKDEILLVEDTDDRLSLPSVTLASGEGIERLEEAVASLAGLPVKIGLLYSLYEDTRTRMQHVVYRADLAEGYVAGGRMLPVADLSLDRIREPATRDILKRYMAESTLGNFGVYVGNQDKGRVHALAGRGDL